jgi:hypothetical protein
MEEKVFGADPEILEKYARMMSTERLRREATILAIEGLEDCGSKKLREFSGMLDNTGTAESEAAETALFAVIKKTEDIEKLQKLKVTLNNISKEFKECKRNKIRSIRGVLDRKIQCLQTDKTTSNQKTRSSQGSPVEKPGNPRQKPRECN